VEIPVIISQITADFLYNTVFINLGTEVFFSGRSFQTHWC